MNVAFDKISAADAARMLGVDRCTVQGWCRNGIINFTNVGDGTTVPRYMIEEDEVRYISELIKKFGSTRSAMLRYRKNWRDGRKPVPVKEPEVIINFDPPVVPEKKEESKPVEKVTSADKIANTIIYIQQIKERIEDCKAELEQLENEYAELKQEVIDSL